jgi:hypothetical protein
MADLTVKSYSTLAITEAPSIDDDFVPTGLLHTGSSSPEFGTPSATDDFDDAKDDSFHPTGLLSGASTTLDGVSQMTLQDRDDFVPTGLLGSNSLLSSTQGS